MSVMKNLFYDIEQAFIDGDSPARIAEALNIPLQMVLDALDTMGVAQEPDYDDSMDGDFDSAMMSAGWGMDEDYGGGFHF